MSAKQLLVVDDQAEITDYIRRAAETVGYKVTTTSDSTKFIDMYRVLKPDTIVMDILMPEIDGIELLRLLAKEKCKSRLLLISGSGEFYLTSAMKLAQDYGLGAVSMNKPIRVRKLRDFLCDAGIDFQAMSDFPL